MILDRDTGWDIGHLKDGPVLQVVGILESIWGDAVVLDPLCRLGAS